MKKVLLVLGLAMCSSMAIAQNPFTRESFPRAKQPTISFAELNAKAPVDYKASIFAKDATFDTLQTCRFTAAEWANIQTGFVAATDRIQDTVVGSINAHAVDINAYQWCEWKRFADTTTFKNTYNTVYSAFHLGLGNAMYVFSDSINASDPGWADDGFACFNYDEDGLGRINAYMALPTYTRSTEDVGKLVYVALTQLYRKYYDRCFIDYEINGQWHTREVNVTGIDCGVNNFGAIKPRFVMPNELASQADIHIRFRLNAPDHSRDRNGVITLPYGYGWMIDNVAIIVDNRSASWQFTFASPIDGFYGMMPQGMTIPMAYGTQVRNTNASAINNATLTLEAGPFNGTLTNVLTTDPISIPAGDVMADYVLAIDERGFDPTVTNGRLYTDPYYLTWFGDSPNYGNATGTLNGGYQGRSLPTTTPGANLYKITANGSTLSTRIDSMLYTVSSNVAVFPGQDNGLSGYRWARDNGFVPSGSSFEYCFTPSGYITNDDEDEHTTTAGYTILVSYVTGNDIPEGWVLKGIELVPATDGNNSTGVNAIEPLVLKDVYSEDGLSFPSVQTGLDGVYTSITESDLSNLPSTGYALPAANGVASHSAINIFLPNQPALEPNTGYHIGYRLQNDARFHVASQSDRYLLNDTTYAYYNYSDETKPYNLQNFPISSYDVYVFDPQNTTSGRFNAANIDEYPMIRAIVGPAEEIPTVTIYGDCETNSTDSTALALAFGSEDLCGSSADVAVGYNYSVVVSGGNKHTVIDAVFVNGQQLEVIEEGDVPDGPYLVRYANGDNVEDAEGNVLLNRDYYAIGFDEIEAEWNGSDSYVITATYHYEDFIPVGIDPAAPEAALGLYPNPATSTVKLNISGVAGMVDCSIIDMSGRVVYNASLNAEAENTINVSNMPAGAYFVRITNNTFSKIEKLIIK